MAVGVDVTISGSEYGKMMTAFDAVRAKLAPLKIPLREMLASQPAKVKAFAATDDGRLLREVYRIRQDLNTFFNEIGWGNADD